MNPAEARRLAEMVFCHPFATLRGGESPFDFYLTIGYPKMTKKPAKIYKVHPKIPGHPTSAIATVDCIEIASNDSFPASDPPAWSAITGTGAPRAGSGPLRNEELSS
jgi:hypothetical protein